MPWPSKQRRAIAARLAREGKSPEEISAFFRKHGHGGDDERDAPADRRRRASRRRQPR